MLGAQTTPGLGYRPRPGLDRLLSWLTIVVPLGTQIEGLRVLLGQ